MQRFGAGESGAFDRLYARHRGPVYRFFLRQCVDAGVAEELSQDTWMKLIDARASYRVKARFCTWLYRIARNNAVDHFRRLSRSVEDHLEFDSQNTPTAGATRETEAPDSRVELHRQLRQLHNLVAALPAAQREVFLLKEEAGLEISDIASVLQENPETVKSRLRYAMQKLREGLT